MAGGDRISDLPDDLLRRILYFAPVKEAASTSALARRWRSLWLSSGAVNLDTRSYHVPDDNLYGKRAAFVRDAHAALDARGRHCPLTKLTFHVEGHGWDTIQVFLCISDDGLKDDIVGLVLSHRAARSVEELCVDAYVGRHPYEDRHESGYYDLSLASLPSKNLRRLRISSCTSLRVPPASAPVAFPRLEELQLHFCSDVPLQDLQSAVDSAPHLAVLDLHSVCLSSSENDVPGDAATHEGSQPPAKLRCPAVTALVMSDCTWTNQTGVELDAPMLRCFRYNGNFREPFALKPQEAANLTRVDIEYFSPGMLCEVPDYIHGLTGQSFTCLQSSLRCVCLRFRRDDSNRFGVRLAKFLAENAMVLEEMHIDDGNQKMWEHINHVVGRSVAGSGSGFAVLPLETRN